MKNPFGPSRRLRLICHDIGRGRGEGRNNFNCLQPADGDIRVTCRLTTGSLKLQSARHSLAATAWQRSGCPLGEKKRKQKEKRNERVHTRVCTCTHTHTHGQCSGTNVFYLSIIIIIIAKMSSGSREIAMLRARARAHIHERLSGGERNIAGQSRIINRGIGVAVTFAKRVRNRDPID